MQTSSFSSEKQTANPESSLNTSKMSNNFFEHQKKFSENVNNSKPHQTLKFDTSQIKFFVDKSKTPFFTNNKLKLNSNETSKNFPKFCVGGLEKITERISEKVSEKFSSSKSSYSKPQSQDSKEESKLFDQSTLKENDFLKKKTSNNPLENIELVLFSFLK